MGIMRNILGLGKTVKTVAEVFVPNASEAARYAHEDKQSAHKQFSEEFSLARTGRFDRFVDGLNRLPRPVLALGTLGLFVYAMSDPIGFALRMQGLAYVPEPLWWLLGAIVSFYFGAREMYYLRQKTPKGTMREMTSDMAEQNPALDAWRTQKDH